MENKYHHGDLKCQLIIAGLHLVQEKGIENVSLRRLARECGVSEAAPYSHFKNKEDLFTAMQEYVTDQLMKCLEQAYEDSVNQEKVYSILNMGKAYVMFFIKYPEYYTFLFSQASVMIDLSMEENSNDNQRFRPFEYYKEKAYEIYRQEGFTEERIKYGIIAMWAKAHGIAAIASMRNIIRDFEWEAELDKILIE